ncbi:dihydrofolate reductase family protein [Pseudonocardia humida]|uniref:Dihydrofolate reductase family protein n=1 Tax=Pseudonocardia humida TaxID=2800819 RepID=A0ABT1A7P3_9PSEU|nr:dihydrofolate reductase family protein [Pseudonocardia humida]MCO1659040.1 dihydrofolate reductase family protein [Pseudonocardia humida]
MQLSVNTFLSLDGVMQGPGAVDEDTSGGFDRGGWLVPQADAASSEVVAGWFRLADAILLGRSTYQMMRTYWSRVTDPDNSVAVALNTYPKHVVSSSLDEAAADWTGTSLVRGDVVDAVRRLKEQPGRELQVHGSHRLARTLHDAGLVDVYRLLYFPVVVGTGKRLFDEGAVPSSFRVDGGEILGSGAVSLTLVPTAFSTGDYVVRGGQEAVTSPAG